MPYELIGHILQMLGLFLAFLCVGSMFILAQITRGGAFSKSSTYLATGTIIIAINFFLTYTATVTGQFNMAYLTIIWPALGAITALGFGFILLSARSFITALGGSR